MIIETLPYTLGSTFDENNIDLEFVKTFKNGKDFYRSYRYSEVYLFELVASVFTYLYFQHGILCEVDYRLDIIHFDYLLEQINNELPEGEKLLFDMFVSYKSYLKRTDTTYIHISELDENFLILHLELN